MNNYNLVSIIIPNINRADLVQKCISSLKTITQDVNYEIIVVDDGSTQEEKIKLQNLSKELNFNLILKDNNTGFSAAINSGIKAASGKYIVLANNDIIFIQHDWLKEMINTANLDQRIGIVGCRLLYLDNRIQHAGMSFNLNRENFEHDYQFQPADFPPALEVKPVPFVTGGLMLIRRETIDEIGLFDETFFVACEDVDYCLRAREARWIVMYCGRAKAIHLEGATRGNTPQNKVQVWYQKELEGYKILLNSINTPPQRKVILQPVKVAYNYPQIIYVLPFLNLTGGVKSVLEQANRLAERGYKVAIYSLEDNLNWFNLKVPLVCYKDFQYLTAALKKLNCIKIATWWETAPIVLNSCDPYQGGRGTPAYYVQDMEDLFYPNSPEIQNKVRATYQLPMLYFTGSEWVKKQLETKYKQKVFNISYAIDLDIFKPQKRIIDYDCRRGIAYSKSDHLKNLTIIEETMSQVSPEIKFISLITFGPQPELKLNNIAHMHFLQPDDYQLAYLYNSSGFFIHNSKHEDFSFPILEAMACGTPVITTRANGNLEYCQDGYNCLLASPDNISELAEKIKQVLTNPDLARQLALNGIKTAQKYNWSSTINKLELFINKALKKNKSPSYKMALSSWIYSTNLQGGV